MDMPEMYGDEVIVKAGQFSPWTHMIAMTGYPAEMGFRAGRCNPDRYLRKGDGLKEIVRAVGHGLALTRLKAASLKARHKGCFKKNVHWRKVAKFRKETGFSPSRFIKSRQDCHAMGVRTLCPRMSFEEISVITGFSSGHHVKGRLSKFLTLL